MADLLLDYTVLDARYTHGKFRFITGDNTVPSIDDPVDTGIDDIRAYPDMDPALFSYMNGSDPRALLCNITTPLSSTPATSTGKYTVCVPTWDSTAGAFKWTTLAKDVALKDSSNNDVAGNPHGIVQAGNFLYTVDYDSAKIYRIDIAAFEAVTGTTYQVTQAADASSFLPATPAGIKPHGTAIITLTNSSGEEEPVVYLYALFVSATNSGAYPDQYYASTIVRYTVDTGSGALSDGAAVTAGPAATALVPAPGTNSEGNPTTFIFVPAVGGTMQYGTTNGINSNLSYVDAFTGFDTEKTGPAAVALTGDPAATVSANGNYDIYGAAVSADGSAVYLLTVTYDANYQACWRLFKTTAAYILGLPITTTPTTLSQATGLTSVDNGFGVPGSYWEVLYDNTVSGGRLWFLKGTPIRVSAGGDYTDVKKQIDYGTGTLYDSAFNVNSADLIGETIYQASQGASVNTRLGTTRTLAKTVQAAAASAEEEEK